MAKKSLFISHISNETELAQSLKQRLEKDFLGLLDIFVSSDRKTIQAGTKWLEEVDKALKDADLQIVLCSKESVGRPWVNFEAGAVWLRGIPVIPVCHSGMKPNDLPVPLSMLQGIEGSQPEGLQQLYDAIAAKLKINVPAVDFKAIADELKELEKKYMLARQVLERIENPRILCAASAQYAQPSLGFDLDVAVLEKAFPQRVTVETELTRKRLLELLTSQRFDIVHLVVAVDPDTGDLVFSPIDFATYKPATPKPDKMPPKSFAALLLESQTSLVVLATCKALLLAVEVAHVANMAASDTEITGEQAEEWEDCFYGLLAQGKSLYKAFDITRSQISTPIRPIRHKDVAFAPETT
jgi:TIR domain